MPLPLQHLNRLPSRAAAFVSRAVVEPLRADTVVGKLTRRLLVAALVLPPLGGLAEWVVRVLGLPGEWRHWLFPAAQMLILVGLAVYFGWVLHRSERLRGMAEVERSTALRQVERQAAMLQSEVARRTSEFAQTLAYNQRLALVASRTTNAVVITDSEGRIEWINEGFTRITGYTAEEAIGRRSGEFLYGPLTRKSSVAELHKARAEGRSCAVEIMNYTKDGRAIAVSVELQPVRNSRGDLTSFIGIATDITARKAAEERLRAAKEEAEQLNAQLEHAIAQAQQSAIEANIASQAKSAFLATMSHEIRTPLNGIIGMAGLLRDTDMDEHQQEFVRTIETSGDALLTIINDILDYSKIEAGRIELERAPFDLRQCVEDALDLFAAKSAEKKVELVCRIAPTVPPAVLGDVTRLRQVIVNLVGNSLKFTATGEVVVTVAPTARAGQLHFTVRDTGIGIPEDRRDRLFQPFSQVDSSTTRKYGGSGLGLAISRRLAEAMEGRMWVESEMGKGSEFHFTIIVPEEPVSARVPWQAAGRAFAGKTVLVYDDNPTGRDWLVDHLAPWGVQTVVAETPGVALATLRAGQPCDLVLLDRSLTAMDDVALAREIGRLPGREKLPVVLMTSLGDSVPTTGFAAKLSKPLKPGAVFGLLQRLWPAEAAPAVAVRPEPISAPATASSLQSLRILLVEDNAVNVKVATMLLAKLGHEPRVALNGAEAIAAFAEEPADVILMDMEMPVMDGCEATRVLREAHPSPRPWIVALTANAMSADRHRALSSGMNDFVSKPIRPADIRTALERAAAGLGRELAAQSADSKLVA
ncbi:MAG: response regulator [Opitutae bacterium]|nr:response regulator [Opitutae bacterium]